MARKPHHTTFMSLLQYHISLYYVMRERNPGIKSNPVKHIEKVRVLEQEFKKELTKLYPDWDLEECREAYRKQIDLLTCVYTKAADKERGAKIFGELAKSMNY